jgi:hypothetical protein
LIQSQIGAPMVFQTPLRKSSMAFTTGCNISTTGVMRPSAAFSILSAASRIGPQSFLAICAPALCRPAITGAILAVRPVETPVIA